MLEGEYVRDKINENNRQIEEKSYLSRFTLNKEINLLLKENQALREQCPHKYDLDNKCIYCGISFKEASTNESN